MWMEAPCSYKLAGSRRASTKTDPRPASEEAVVADPIQSLEDSLRPDISHLVLEDDEPLDNWFQEREQRLLPSILYASWDPGQPFLAAANVGLFDRLAPGVAPDCMVSL